MSIYEWGFASSALFYGDSMSVRKLINLKKEEFDAMIYIRKDSKDSKEDKISLSEAALIPAKVGDEMALTSIFLSSLRLIKEYRQLVLSDIKMPKNGKIYTYKEVSFKDFGLGESRVDGLVIVVVGGVIKDAAIFEMKSGTDILKLEQIEKYTRVAEAYGIPRIVTVSNEYVSEPTQSPLDLKSNKLVSYFHLPWSYLLTLAHVLLIDNELNIEDEDQVNIMLEVVKYFEAERSGITGFHQMKQGWADTVEKINCGTSLKIDDRSTIEAVESWVQEERDLALKLSRELGVLVKSGDPKYKTDLKKRIQANTKELVEHKHLESCYQISNAVSDIRAKALLERRAVMFYASLKAPADKTLRGQLTWIKNQFDTCMKRNTDEFKKIESELFIEVAIKNVSKTERVKYSSIDALADELKGREIKEFKIIYQKDFGKDLSSRNKFVTIIEEMGTDFYSAVVQNLKKWEAPAPRVKDKIVEEQTEAMPEGTESGDVCVSNDLNSELAIASVLNDDESTLQGEDSGAENCQMVVSADETNDISQSETDEYMQN